MPEEHPYFQDRPPLFKALTLLVIVFFFASIGALISQAILTFKLDIENTSQLAKYMEENPGMVNIVKMMQILASLSMFLLPPLVFSLLIYRNPIGALSLDKVPRLWLVLLVPVILLASMPSIKLLLDLNQSLSLPEFMKGVEDWMVRSEKSAEGMITMFLRMETPLDLAINLFMIGVLPAIGEELLFRGAVQKLFTDWTKNKHYGVWVAAFMFSAMHMQFFGFLPRFALGLLLGYLLVWSGSLWIPMLAHFAYNSSQVIAVYLSDAESIDMTGQDAPEIGWLPTFFSIIILIISLVLFKRMGKSGILTLYGRRVG